MIGLNIRFMRILKGLKIKDLSDKMGITCRQFAKYEKGVNRIPASAIWDCGRIMNCDVNCFFKNIN
jgi:transcriptional regulator with XRE-family HTH domain